MTDEERIVKHCLEGYLDAMRKVKRAKELYERLYASATGTQIQYGGPGSNSTPSDTVGNAVVMLDEAREKIVDKQMDADAIKEQIEYMCEFIRSEKIRYVIKAIYLEDKPRSEIAKALDCKMQTVTNMKYTGIKEIARCL